MPPLPPIPPPPPPAGLYFFGASATIASDNTLDIRSTANGRLGAGEYDFKVFDDPAATHVAIEAENGGNKARVITGYCWPWKSKKTPSATDINLGDDYKRRWNLDQDGSLWIIAESSINEVGCIHTRQGLEVDYIGVIVARWRLVETSWRLGMSRALVLGHDSTEGVLWMPDAGLRRKAVTSSRHALNGYQQGRCFYCSGQISLTDPDSLADVDHFFPHALKQAAFGTIIDGVWNLVLACRPCNRGVAGKSDRVPTERLLERLHTRNEFLIGSHHPLRETLITQTGNDENRRRGYLRDIHRKAWATLIHCWEPR